MKILILSMFLIPQQDTINIQNLESSLMEFYHFKTQSEIIEFSQNEKLGFLKYLPIPQLVNRNGYHLEFSFSVTQIYAYANDKEKQKQSIESIEKRNEIELNNDLQELRNAILFYENSKLILDRKRQNLSNKLKLLNIEKKLFEIEESKFERNRISPTQFLQAKKRIITAELNYKNHQFEILQFEINIKNQINEIYKLAKFLK